jgi:hypothetical protein
MRIVASAPDTICADADLGENRDARAATRQVPRPPLQSRKEGARNATQPAKCSPLTLRVIDDLPDVVPVAPHELDVIEIYLRAVLDGFLGTTEENPQP